VNAATRLPGAVVTETQVKAIVLFGAPGSGKGTQARLLSDCLHIPHVSTGEILRERIRSGAENGSVAATMHSGDLVADDLVNRLVEERLSQSDAAAGFILDGYPRTTAQAEHLLSWFDAHRICEVVIYLSIDYNVVIARLRGRRQCPQCGTLYNIVSQPPKVAGLCDLDGQPLVIREDDREEVIRERLDAYQQQTSPVLEYFRSAGRQVRDVDAGDAPPDEIYRKIVRALEWNDRTEDRC
jgi:adenylate kinase